MSGKGREIGRGREREREREREGGGWRGESEKGCTVPSSVWSTSSPLSPPPSHPTPWHVSVSSVPGPSPASTWTATHK